MKRYFISRGLNSVDADNSAQNVFYEFYRGKSPSHPDTYIYDDQQKNHFFTGIVLVLTMVGVCGQLHYTTTRRIREIGIRLSLGATTGDTLVMVLRQGLKLILIGVGIGLAGAMAFTRVLSNLLYGISATDPLILALVSLALIGIALLASFLPVHRAAKTDPMKVLRYE